MLLGEGFSGGRPLKRQMPKSEETPPPPLERMRKKSHFGKLISIGNKSLQTADRAGGGGGGGGGGEGGAAEHKFRRIKIPKFSGEEEEEGSGGRAEQTEVLTP